MTTYILSKRKNLDKILIERFKYNYNYNIVIMQLFEKKEIPKKEGIVIQIKTKNYKAGDSTLSMTVYGESVPVAFGRIKNLYESLSNSTEEEVLIRHKK